MSTSSSRRRRLLAARDLPATRCPGCDTPLERVVHVGIHLKRCDDRMAAEQEQLQRLIEAGR